MIADMLFLAKADNGLVIPTREPVDLAHEVGELFEFFEALADDGDSDGLGLMLVQGMTESLTYDRLDDLNRVRMRMRRS
jgi:hypothetical protein